MIYQCLKRVLAGGAMLAVVVAVSACNKSKTNDAVGQGSNNGGGSPPGMAGRGPGRPRGPIFEIMTKLGRGPQSLTNVIGRELSEEPVPPWDKIQPQAKEYAQLAASISKYDPPKGDKESWQRLSASFSRTATDLEHAAEKKDKKSALAAHEALNTSCKECHNAHKGGPQRGFGPPRGSGGPPEPPQ
ncbi:MAG: hypothetical protein ACYC3I_15835 [Gemmataceae bacterium]